jgi:hypothetical protein
LQVQFTWGSTVQNPVAEKWAGHEWGTPDFIWDILGAIDPILGPDGCVYSDPKPNQPSVKLFCIGNPAGNNEILLHNGMRLPVGKHLEIWGRSLVDQAGNKVADVPWLYYLKNQAGTALDSMVECIKTHGPTALYVVDQSIGGCITGGVEGVLPFPEAIPLPRGNNQAFQISEGLCQAATGALMMLTGGGELNAVLRGGVQMSPRLVLMTARGSTALRSVEVTTQLANQCAKAKVGYLMMQGANATTSGVEKIGRALSGPADRHWAAKVKQKTLAKEKNTVIEPRVDVQKDVDAINAGNAVRTGDMLTINGRNYGIHDGTLYPISGDGFYQLDRGAFKALGVFNEFGDTKRAAEILDKMGASEAQRAAALEVYKRLHP